MNRPTIASLTLLLLTAPVVPLPAQDADGQTVSVPTAPLRIGRIPIHGGADDEGLPYGLWAATDTYKVSFHGAPTFVPYLGKDAPRNLPVAWHTTSVRIGDRELLRPGERPAGHRSSDYRYEYRYGAVTEAYEVLEQGLEQMFVLPTDPGVRGAIVVTGSLETPLRVAPIPAAHGSLDLCDDDGDPVVRYGEAIAFDSAGRRVDVLTASDGRTIRLTVPADWVAGAAFPITIDPLTTNVRVHGGAAHYNPDVARDDQANRLTSVTLVAASSADFDAYALSTADCFGSTPRFDWVDVSASWSTNHARVAALDAPAKILIAVSRSYPHARSSRVRYHVRSASDPTLSSQVNAWGPPATSHDWLPEIGGTSYNTAGDKAVIVYQQENTGGGPFANTPNSRICARLIDVSAGTGVNATHGGQRTVLGAASFDYAFAAVNRSANPLSNPAQWGWVFAFQFWNTRASSPRWKVGAKAILASGDVPLYEWIARPSASSQQQLGPTIAGTDGRYLVAVTEAAASLGKLSGARGSRVAVQRFDWTLTRPPTGSQPVRILRSDSSRRWFLGKAVYDTTTDSHWVVPTISYLTAGGTGNVFLHRCGYRGAQIEAVTLHNASATSPRRPGNAAAVCFDVDNQQFVAVFAANGAPGSIQPVLNAMEGACYTYNPVTPPWWSGTGCSPTAAMRWFRSPLVGSEFTRLEMWGIPTGRSAAVALSLGTDSITGVPGTGPGCRFLLSLSPSEFLTFLPAQVGPRARWDLPLPETLRDRTWLHLQAWHLDAGGTQFLGTRRLTVEFRR